MNCLVQKAMKDHVFTNKCVLDSVLWFHLECPSFVEKFDNPAEFRAKVRDFFAWQNREAKLMLTGAEQRDADSKLLPAESIKHTAAKEVRMFRDEFEALDPTKKPFATQEELDEAVKEDKWGEGAPTDEHRLNYKPPHVPLLQVSDSDKFSNQTSQQ